MALDGLEVHSTRPGDSATWLSADAQLVKLHRLKTLYCSCPSPSTPTRCTFSLPPARTWWTPRAAAPVTSWWPATARCRGAGSGADTGCWAGQAAARARCFATMAVRHLTHRAQVCANVCRRLRSTTPMLRAASRSRMRCCSHRTSAAQVGAAVVGVAARRCMQALHA